jgi:hypothetical protein
MNPIAQTTLWQAIDTLANQIPLSQQKLEAALQTKLRESHKTSNESFEVFKSGRVALKDSVAISAVDQRVKRVQPDLGFLVLNIEGACTTLEPECLSSIAFDPKQ